MNFDVVPADRLPSDLRDRYFSSLPGPQVHYVEQRVSRSSAFVVRAGATDVGYAAIHGGAVVEFYAADMLLPALNEAFEAAARIGGATSALAKSYDGLMLAAAAGRPSRVSIVGVNSSDWSDARYEPPQGFTARPGTHDDFPIVQGVGPGWFEFPDEIPIALAAGQVTIYALDGEPVGAGLLTPIRDGAPELDLGVGVLPAWRGRGFGAQIMRNLKHVCLTELGVRPTCGCAAENIASRRTLERAGFLTRHRLLELCWT